MTSVHPSGQSAPIPTLRAWQRIAFLAALAVLTALLVDVGTALAQTPDLTAEKINDVGGVIGPGDPFTWTITVENQGTADAVIRAGAMLVSDALPSGPIYGPLAVNTTGVENLAALDCKTSALVISCRAVGDAITMTVGSSVQVSLPVTPTTTGDLVNPAAPGVCRADPTNFVAESRSVFESVSADVKEMAAAKSPTDLIQLQSEMFRKSFDSAVAYGSKNTEAMIKIASDAMAPISGRVSLAVEKVRSVAA